jgi:hypothetical protein
MIYPMKCQWSLKLCGIIGLLAIGLEQKNPLSRVRGVRAPVYSLAYHDVAVETVPVFHDIRSSGLARCY